MCSFVWIYTLCWHVDGLLATVCFLKLVVDLREVKLLSESWMVDFTSTYNSYIVETVVAYM